MLNISGRVELIKNIIHPMIQFWLRFTYFPLTVIQRINSLCANFLWKSKTHKMSWEDACKTKSEGGFGIRKIEDLSKAVVVNLLWKFINGESLWAKWTKNRYNKKDNFWSATMKPTVSFIWKTILRARQWCNGLINRNIVNGETTNLWLDPWINGSTLLNIVGRNDMDGVNQHNTKSFCANF